MTTITIIEAATKVAEYLLEERAALSDRGEHKCAAEEALTIFGVEATRHDVRAVTDALKQWAE